MAEYIDKQKAIDAVTVRNIHPGIVNALQSLIIEIPAADVVPVRRGRWHIVKLPPSPGYKAKECSECKCNFWDLEEWDYCPNCGAKMEDSE